MSASEKGIICRSIIVRNRQGTILYHWKSSFITRIYLEEDRIIKVGLFGIGLGAILRSDEQYVEARHKNEPIYFYVFLLAMTCFILSISVFWGRFMI